MNLHGILSAPSWTLFYLKRFDSAIPKPHFSTASLAKAPKVASLTPPFGKLSLDVKTSETQ